MEHHSLTLRFCGGVLHHSKHTHSQANRMHRAAIRCFTKGLYESGNRFTLFIILAFQNGKRAIFNPCRMPIVSCSQIADLSAHGKPAAVSGTRSAAIFCKSKQPNDRRYQQNRCRSNNNSRKYAAADKIGFLSRAHIFFRNLSLLEKLFQIGGDIIAPAESVCRY